MNIQRPAHSCVGALAGCLFWGLVPWLTAACGGAAPPPTSTATVPAAAIEVPPSPRPIPDDLWLLVPANAMAVGDVDLTQVRRWSQYATVRRWLSQYACVQEGELTALLDRVDRVVVAVGVLDERARDGVLLLRGTFTDRDVLTLAPEVDAAMTPQLRGRWHGYTSEQELIALLDDRTLLIASGTWRDAVLNMAATGEGDHVRTALFVQALAPSVSAEGAAVLAMAAPTGDVAADILRDLGRWGGSVAAIAAALAAEPYWGARATIGSDDAGINVVAVATGGTEPNAAALIDAMNSAFWQAGLFMRLIGLPPILANANLRHSGATATVALQASGEENATLLSRLEDLVRAEAPPCVTTPAIAVSPSP